MIYGNDLNEIFERVFGGSPNYNYRTSVVTKTDGDENYEINHTKDGAYLFFDAPGFNKTNLKVEMENGNLYIEGKRSYKINGEEKTKSISKQFRIGDGYDPASLEATIDNGLLTVFVPNFKKQEKKRISLL